MSFPRYPSYKDSGVEWLGEVPAHWQVLAVKRAAKLESGHTPSRSHPEYWENCTVPWFTLGDVWQIRQESRRYITETAEKVSGLGLANSAARLLPKGTVMLSRTASVGFAAIMGVPMATTQDFANWICGPRLSPEFLLYAFQAMVGEFRRLMMGSTHNTIYMPDLQSFRIAVPSLDEQSGVIEFLDRETAKIDELVAEQRRLMELLKEKRQAVISHVVTRGLNPKAPLKFSSIEWLGDIPAHWKAGKCGFYVTILSGFAFPSSGFTNEESATPLLRGINVGVGQLRWDETVYWRRSSNDDLDIYEMRAGDLVIGMDRPLINEGMRVAKVQENDLPCLLLQRVAKLTAGPSLSSNYLLRLLSSEMFVAHFFPETTGVSVPHISPEQIRDFIIPVPPLAEQSAIVRHLDAETAKFDTLTAEAQRAIDLLQERRTALISAAVTGQIDVRGVGSRGGAELAEELLHAAEAPAAYGARA